MFTLILKDKDNLKVSFEDKITLKDLAKQYGINAIVAKVNNRLRELNYYVNYNATIDFLDLRDLDAVRVYETSMRYLVIMALENLYPGIKVYFGQCISRSLYCHAWAKGVRINEEFLEKLEKEMKRIISLDLPITRYEMTKEEARRYYEEKGYLDKSEVLKYREEDIVHANKCGDYINYMFGYLVSSTGALGSFKLRLYYPGFIIQLPRSECNGDIPEFEEAPVFGKMIKDAKEWAKLCKCEIIPDLNKYAQEWEVVDLVTMCETRHNNMLAELGDIIKSRKNDIRLVCIAGPSSSGKTTFSHRLRIELLSKGLKTIKISMDDYYKDRSECPLDEDGKPDFEHVEALDLKLFNENLLSLIEGEEVRLPVFDFKIGKRVPGEPIKIDSDTIIIIEGIHALNEQVTRLIPKHQKYKIYISPLSQINIDNHNPIPATDIRLLRRIVRDEMTRHTNPSKTFAMWPSVRRGEFRWIYPNQEQADYVFNTELTYELAVMKKYALASLQTIEKNDEYYIQANRLIKFLKYIHDIDEKYVPCNSLLREFIGGSCFYDFYDENKKLD
ncbi:MAG: nucleoside kinase [Bacilli bacterium]|nr:nucleoside kinase [Bacilli bacterium]